MHPDWVLADMRLSLQGAYMHALLQIGTVN